MDSIIESRGRSAVYNSGNGFTYRRKSFMTKSTVNGNFIAYYLTLFKQGVSAVDIMLMADCV